MAFYGDNLPTFIREETEDKLRQRLVLIQAEQGSLLNVIQIYPRGSYVYAWFTVDVKRFAVPPTNSDKTSKEKPNTIKEKIKKAK